LPENSKVLTRGTQIIISVNIGTATVALGIRICGVLYEVRLNQKIKLIKMKAD
jgi:hypothetical protein